MPCRLPLSWCRANGNPDARRAKARRSGRPRLGRLARYAGNGAGRDGMVAAKEDRHGVLRGRVKAASASAAVQAEISGKILQRHVRMGERRGAAPADTCPQSLDLMAEFAKAPDKPGRTKARRSHLASQSCPRLPEPARQRACNFMNFSLRLIWNEPLPAGGLNNVKLAFRED